MKRRIYDGVVKVISHPLGLWVLAVLLVIVDYNTGPAIQFPVVFLLPILIAAWRHSKAQAFLLAVALPLTRFSFNLFVWTAPWTLTESLLNMLIRMTVLATLAYFVARVKTQNDMLTKEVKTLSGILPICGFCKKIRTDQEEWVPVEVYVRDRSEAQFSHGFCPECGREHYGDLLE